MKYMRRIEQNKKWQTRVKKRSLAYFQIVRRWAEFIQTTVQTNHLFWQDIPGYRQIVKSILLELKQRPIKDYPDSLIDATVELIQNPELFTVIMTIIFAKTNVYDSATVCTTMGLLNRLFNHLEKQGLEFPTNFDFNFFLQGISITLDLDHSLSIPRTLHLLYRTLHFFPIEQRALLILEIFKKFLYRLFFSWSYNIRDLFVALFLYQIEYLYVFRLTNHLMNSLETQGINKSPSGLSLRNGRPAVEAPFRANVSHAVKRKDKANPVEGPVSVEQMLARRKENFSKYQKII